MIKGPQRPSTAAIREALEAICGSVKFRKAPSLARLLAFLVEAELSGESDLLKEIYVGCKFFGRDPDYDPKIDTVVRVHVTRLRAKLEDYDFAHRHAAVQIVLARGSYIPAYISRTLDLEANLALNLDVHLDDAVSSPNVLVEQTGYPTFPPHTQEAPLPALTSRRSVSALAWTLYAASLLLIAVSVLASVRHFHAAALSWQERPFSRPGGMAQFPRFRPDGQQVVFALSQGGPDSAALFLQDLHSDVPRRLSPAGAMETRPAWSRDGKRLAFLQKQPDGRLAIVVRDLQTGRQIEVADTIGADPWLCKLPRLDWTPDGRELLTSAPSTQGDDPTNQRCGIVAINTETHAVRTLTYSPQGTLGDLEAAVSPDGKTIAFLRSRSFASQELFLIDVDGTHLRQLTNNGREILGFTWNHNGNSLILASVGEDGLHRLIEQSLTPQRSFALTDGAVPAAFPDIAPDGRQVVFTSYRSAGKVLLVSGDKQKEILEDGTDNRRPQLSPDGLHLAYLSNRTGGQEVWISDPEGNNPQRFTTSAGSMVSGEMWTPDSKALVFECRQDGHGEICLKPLAGGAVQFLTYWTSDQMLPRVSPSGDALYFLSNHSGRTELYRMALAGESPALRPTGTPVQITQGGVLSAAESPDASILYIDTPKASVGMLRVPSGLAAIDTSELTPQTQPYLQPALNAHGPWFPTSQGLVLMQAGPAGTRLSLYRPGHAGLARLLDLHDVIDEGSAGHAEGSFYLTTPPKKTGDLYLLTAH